MPLTYTYTTPTVGTITISAPGSVAPTLQAVTDSGATTTDTITAAGFVGSLTGTAAYATTAGTAAQATTATTATTISGSVQQAQVSGLTAALTSLQTAVASVPPPTLQHVTDTGATTTDTITTGGLQATGNWNLVNPAGVAVLNLNGSNLPFWLVKVEFGADVEATKDLYVDGTLRLTGGITNQYNNPVYVYNTNNRGVVLGDSATTQTGNVIDMALPTTFRSTVTLPTLPNLSTPGQAGSLGYYNGNLYYSNGTAWRRSSGTYTGIAF